MFTYEIKDEYTDAVELHIVRASTGTTVTLLRLSPDDADELADKLHCRATFIRSEAAR